MPAAEVAVNITRADDEAAEDFSPWDDALSIIASVLGESELGLKPRAPGPKRDLTNVLSQASPLAPASPSFVGKSSDSESRSSRSPRQNDVPRRTPTMGSIEAADPTLSLASDGCSAVSEDAPPGSPGGSGERAAAPQPSPRQPPHVSSARRSLPGPLPPSHEEGAEVWDCRMPHQGQARLSPRSTSPSPPAEPRALTAAASCGSLTVSPQLSATSRGLGTSASEPLSGPFCSSATPTPHLQCNLGSPPLSAGTPRSPWLTAATHVRDPLDGLREAFARRGLSSEPRRECHSSRCLPHPLEGERSRFAASLALRRPPPPPAQAPIVFSRGKALQDMQATALLTGGTTCSLNHGGCPPGRSLRSFAATPSWTPSVDSVLDGPLQPWWRERAEARALRSRETHGAKERSFDPYSIHGPRARSRHRPPRVRRAARTR